MQRINNHKNVLFMSLLLLFLYSIAWYLQNQLLLNADVRWLMEASRRLQAGGSYQRDFFELNPPLILYLYMPAVLLTKMFQFPEAMSLRLYVFGLSFVSISLCFYLSKRIFNHQDQFIRTLFLFIVATLFWIFPIYEFGQRELLLLILSFPYFFLVALRLYHQDCFKKLSYIIGFLAGTGFAMKPYFLSAPLLIEFYYICKSKDWKVWKRPEVKGIVTVLVIYALLLVLFHRDYLTYIVPFINQFYFQDYRSPFKIIFFNDQAIYFYFCLSLVALFYNKIVYKQLTLILVMAALGFYLSYLLQSTYWYYHVLPMFALSVAIYALLFCNFITIPLSKNDYIKLGLWLSLFILYLINKVSYISLGISFYPSSYFWLFLSIFSPILYLAYRGQQLTRVIITLAILFLTAFIFYKNVQLSIWLSHLFLMMNLFLLCSFVLALPQNAQTKARYLFFAFLGLVIFAYPFYWSAYLYTSSLEFKNHRTPTPLQIRHHQHKNPPYSNLGARPLNLNMDKFGAG